MSKDIYRKVRKAVREVREHALHGRPRRLKIKTARRSIPGAKERTLTSARDRELIEDSERFVREHAAAALGIK